MKKRASIYFLLLSLPATCAGILPIYMVGGVMIEAQKDAHLMGHLNLPVLYSSSAALLVFIIIGLCFVPGYFRQVFLSQSVTDTFWKYSAIYNIVLSVTVLIYLLGLFMKQAPRGDISIIIFMALVLGLPALGSILSIRCWNSSHSKKTDKHAR